MVSPSPNEVVAIEGPRGALLAAPVRENHVEFARAVVLRGAARSLFELIREGGEFQEAVALLVRSGASEDQARGDVERFLGDLSGAGFPGIPRACSTSDSKDAGGSGREPSGSALATEDLLSLARETLRRGHGLRFQAHGQSMRPWVPDGAWLDIEARPLSQVRPGEVVFYTAPGSTGLRWVAHRVLRTNGLRLETRGDSALRLDEVGDEGYLGVVKASRVSGSGWKPVSSGWRRHLGLWTGRVYALGVRGVQTLVLGPFRRTYRGPSLLRGGLRMILRVVSGFLRFSERASVRLRRPVDYARAALLSAEEKDEERRELYEKRSIQAFTSLDENMEAGLTPLEEVLLTRHPVSGRALVLGCGPGRECLVLAREGVRVSGLDREEGMLERARDYARREELEIDYFVGEAHDFEAPGAPFDAVLILSGLYNMVLPRERRVAMLVSAREHLREGGKVHLTFLSAYIWPGRAPGHAGPGWLERFSPDHSRGDEYLLNECIHVFPTQADLEEEARDAGLEVVEVHRDQRAYDRFESRVRGWAVFRRPVSRG